MFYGLLYRHIFGRPSRLIILYPGCCNCFRPVFINLVMFCIPYCSQMVLFLCLSPSETPLIDFTIFISKLSIFCCVLFMLALIFYLVFHSIIHKIPLICSYCWSLLYVSKWIVLLYFLLYYILYNLYFLSSLLTTIDCVLSDEIIALNHFAMILKARNCLCRSFLLYVIITASSAWHY